MDPRIVKQLDAYWSKAVKLAKEKSGDAKVVQRIFQNLLSMSKEEIAAWWIKLSPKGKQKYLEKYPGSKYAKKVRAARKKKVLTKEDKALLEGIKDEPKTIPEDVPDNVPEVKSEPEEPKTEVKSEPEEPKTEVKPEPEQPRSLRDRLMGAWTKRRTKVVDTLRHHGKGLQLVKSVLGGEKVSDAQFEHAKKTATLAASLVLGAFAAVAVVTLAPAFAAPIAAMFLEDGSNSFSYSSDNSEELASEIADKMYDWIMSQDQEALKKRLENYNAE